MFYLTWIIFFRTKKFHLGNFRLNQSKLSNFDHPQTAKLTKRYFFLGLSNEPVACERSPAKCQYMGQDEYTESR